MLTKAKIKQILSSRIEEINSLSIPHFALLSDIEKAAKRIVNAINNNEKIVIVGDYDVDGVSSCAIMHLFLSEIYDNFEIKIPNRFKHGYGLTPKILEEIDAGLIITVDNGISSFEAAEICAQRGIDLIITDHHTPKVREEEIGRRKKEGGRREEENFNSESKLAQNSNLKTYNFSLPKAYAVVNPKTSPDFPFKEICGAEVAWYLCAALKHEMKLKKDLREFLDILCIAIIADVMPLQHMNRTLVNMGLKRLNAQKRAFSRAIKKFFSSQIRSVDIAFNIAPRLNAAGRMDDARVAFEFLISDDENQAYNLYLELDRLNNLRKETEKEILEDIEVENEEFIVVKGDYHEGVIGIIASRLVHKYNKPAIVFSRNGESLKGSGRSLGNVDIFSLISECEDVLEGFGGHKLACGLSVKEEKFEILKRKLNEKIKKYNENDFFIEDFVLGELPFSEIDIELLDILHAFEPYGEGNPKPKFITTAKIEHIQNLKDNHFKLILSQNDIYLPAVIFRYDGEFDEIINFKFTVEENNYRGRTVQLVIEEIL